jgi:Rad3-related DNA helicase
MESSEQRIKSSGGKQWSADLKRLRDIKRKLERLAGMQADDGWIINETEVRGKSTTSVRFDPLNPARYAEQALWRGVDKIVLVSATVRPKTVELLGIAPDDLEFCEYESSFDPKRRPTIYIPSERMTFHSEQDDDKMRWWLSTFDSLVGKNLHHKGLVHCVSYRRMEFIKNNSQYAQFMLTHNTHDRSRIIEEFRRREAPAILLSPSVDTGYDFPNEQSRWMIVAKLPFASAKDRVIKARQEKDKEYGMYLAAQTLVQMSGRCVRSAEDFAACYILDGNWEWFQGRARRYFPRWFQEAIVWADRIPEPIQFDEQPCIWCGKEHAGGPENCTRSRPENA